MELYYSDPATQIYQGNAIDVLRQLPEESIQCVVTSPPYWGLRRYEGDQDVVWGDDHCEHEWVARETKRMNQAGGASEKQESNRGSWVVDYSNRVTYSQFCWKCGAWKGQLGLEPTPELYVQHLVEIFEEVKRVLKRDGVCFLNIGDTYVGSGCGTNDYRTPESRSINKTDVMFTKTPPQQRFRDGVLKPKDLALIPFRLAIALQEAGWYIRSDIIWSKPNCMPESVKDRPTTSHEHILMLTKSAKYYWDQEAIKEPYSDTVRWGGDTYKGAVKGDGRHESAGLDRERSVYPGSGRNPRSVWTMKTEPCPQAHFAVFPEELPGRCIKAATSEKGNCSKCGKPWVRETTRSKRNVRPHRLSTGKAFEATHTELGKMVKPSAGFSRTGEQFEWQIETVGWKPQCNCKAEAEPPVVLDPFAGTGRTGLAARKLGRKSILIDISEDYCEMAKQAVSQVAIPML